MSVIFVELCSQVIYCDFRSCVCYVISRLHLEGHLSPPPNLPPSILESCRYVRCIPRLFGKSHFAPPNHIFYMQFMLRYVIMCLSCDMLGF